MIDHENIRCLQKQAELKTIFNALNSSEEKYQKIIEFGKRLFLLPNEYHKDEYLVEGCQSRLYLKTDLCEGRLHFKVYSEALISAGLAALLLEVYNDETPQTLLTCPPNFIKELNLHAALSPGRSNGLSSMFLRMQQDALKLFSNLH